MKFVIESALLTHGLLSIGNQELADLWPEEYDNIVWVEQGRLMTGGMERFLPWRAQAAQLPRLDSRRLEHALREGLSGALTASGAMSAALRLGCTLAVSAGIVGIGGWEMSADLDALATLPAALIATSPKDMLDIPATVAWLRQHGVTVWGREQALCSGYIFNGGTVKLDGCLPSARPSPLSPQHLLLNPISPEQRLPEPVLLAQAVAAGQAARSAGGYFHPAVCGELDRLSNGYSSSLQLRSLIANAALARELA